MIEFVARSGPPEAMNCPAFICDACGKQVTHHGNVYWGADDNTTGLGAYRRTPTYASHKGNCVTTIENWFRRAYPDDTETTWSLCDTEISQFMQHLKFNFWNRFEDDVRHQNVEYHAHQIVMPAVPTPASFRQIGRYDSALIEAAR